MSIHAMPNTPSSAGDSPVMPSSPAELPVPAQSQATNDAAPVRRKASRRANTAERRATHNAVERQRRETLNGRFLDLAALLPNLASVRRPSKSAIVNSSIALVHSQRRQRAVAARELRQLKVEADALRREFNEWRERANVPRIEEPARNADFVALLNLEEEEIGEDERRAYEMRDGDDAEDLDEEGSDHVHELHQNHAPAPVMTTLPSMAPSYNGNYHDQAGLIVSGTAPDPEKVAAWNQHLYSALAQSQWAQQAQAAHTALFTPPSSAHGVAPPNPFAQANHGYLANFQRPHNGLSPVPVHYTHGEDDNSSVGSAGSGSPHGSQGSLPGSYEIPGPFAFDPYTAAAAPRRPSVQIPPMAVSGPGGAWSPHGQMMKTSPVPIQAGGGGGGAHFAMNLLL